MRLTSHTKTNIPICLAIYGKESLEFVTEFINQHRGFEDSAGNKFSVSQLAGQYAFEQVKLDRKGYDSRRLEKYLSYLSDAGAVFSFNEALSHADDLINCFTADFGHDEDGEATFRIKAQSYRLKKYDCQALWERVKQSELTVSSVKTGSLSFDDLSDEDSSSEGLSDDILDFTIKFELKDCSNEVFAYLFRYVTADSGQLSVEDLVDFQFVDYPNFHDESMTMLNIMEVKAKEKDVECLTSVLKFVENQNMQLGTTLPEPIGKSVKTEPKSIDIPASVVATLLVRKNLV